MALASYHHHMLVVEDMEDLVVGMALVNGRGMVHRMVLVEHTDFEEDSHLVVVAGRHRLLGVEEECWRSWGLVDKESESLEEGIAAAEDIGLAVRRRKAAGGLAGHLRNSRDLT